MPIQFEAARQSGRGTTVRGFDLLLEARLKQAWPRTRLMCFFHSANEGGVHLQERSARRQLRRRDESYIGTISGS